MCSLTVALSLVPVKISSSFLFSILGTFVSTDWTFGKAKKYYILQRKLYQTRSGHTFAEWDGLSVSASPFFDVYETAITNHLHQDEQLEADVQDTPHLESDDAASPADSTNPSPLSSPPPSPAIPRAVSPQPGEKRKSHTRRSNKEKKNSPNTPGSTPTSAPTPLLPNQQKKSTARSHISRANQRKKEKEEHGPANYQPRAEVGETLLQTASPLPACLNSNNIKDATSGYLGQASRVSKESKKVRKIWKLEELCGPGSVKTGVDDTETTQVTLKQRERERKEIDI
ncbi:hypothetical protein VKT23_016706 [Stygiomarasmius scandens]|uniref:Uncharacterized protein n=1 Tax=Marasmiellus scandens TaxID=2682957 RepID=A0ABR1IUH6_9AGAR